MRFEQIIWLPAIEEKLFRKHHVIRREVEEALKSKPLVKFVEKDSDQVKMFMPLTGARKPDVI